MKTKKIIGYAGLYTLLVSVFTLIGMTVKKHLNFLEAFGMANLIIIGGIIFICTLFYLLDLILKADE